MRRQTLSTDALLGAHPDACYAAKRSVPAPHGLLNMLATQPLPAEQPDASDVAKQFVPGPDGLLNMLSSAQLQQGKGLAPLIPLTRKLHCAQRPKQTNTYSNLSGLLI